MLVVLGNFPNCDGRYLRWKRPVKSSLVYISFVD